MFFMLSAHQKPEQNGPSQKKLFLIQSPWAISIFFKKDQPSPSHNSLKIFQGITVFLAFSKKLEWRRVDEFEVGKFEE